jgi:hypothetical protein
LGAWIYFSKANSSKIVQSWMNCRPLTVSSAPSLVTSLLIAEPADMIAVDPLISNLQSLPAHLLE